VVSYKSLVGKTYIVADRLLFWSSVTRFLLSFLLVGALYRAPAETPAAPDARKTFEQIDEIMADLSRITGLKQQRRVPADLINRDQLKQFLEQRVKEVVKPEELRIEELTLKKFGFAPADFNLKETTIDLLTEQAAAFYDHKKKRLFLLDYSSSAVQQMALVHELAHALADQHFHMEKFIERGNHSDDSSLARMAVVEGQATWLMAEYMASKMGQSLKTSPSLVDMMSRMTENSDGSYPVMNRVPLYLRESLVFPYSQGVRFQNAVCVKLGMGAFAEVFRRPPVSTQQILHPEKYFSGENGGNAALPDFETRKEYKMLASGSVGEFDHAILLRQYGGKEAEPLSAQWKAGNYKLFESKGDRRVVLAYASDWQTEDAAREFFSRYRQILQGKWKKLRIEDESADSLRGEGDDGFFVLRREGAHVSSLEGLRSLPAVAAASTLH
jgi:hypothetical protein